MRGMPHKLTKQGIFWELSYQDKLVCHILDIIHIKKNVCEQIIHTIMDIKGKLKADVNARRDLANLVKVKSYIWKVLKWLLGKE